MSFEARVPVTLPTGLVREGVRERVAVLRPLTGREEEVLQGMHDLSQAERVSRLLAACVERIGTGAVGLEHVRMLTVGDREALLLHLRRATVGDPIGCVLGCPAPSCRERLDVRPRTEELLLAPYADPRDWYEEWFESEAGAVRVRFRIPTGGDQEAVAGLAAVDPAAAARRLLERCVESVEDGEGGRGSELDELLGNRLASRMSELDPQAELLLDLVCPACGTRFESLLDTGAFFMAELSASARTLYDEVHTLACWYHWGEGEILRLTAPKRRRYLELIAARAPAGVG
jgi:hypothetical protein